MMAKERAASLAFWASRDVTITPVGDVEEELGLGCGRTNQNFIATINPDGERFFVRIGGDLPAYGVTRVKEHAAARAAATAGVGAAVLYAELPDALVTAFVEGRALTEKQVRAACSGADSKLLDAHTVLEDGIR